MGNIIGRKQEIQELNDLYNSNKAQMVAVYGRRRVGKTFLVDEALKGKITLQESRVAAYIKANQGNLFFDEATDPALQKIRAKVEFAKERVALAEARLKVKVEQYQKEQL